MGIRVGNPTDVLHRGSCLYEVPTASEGKSVGIKSMCRHHPWGKKAGTYITRTKLFKEDNLEPKF